MFDLEMLFGGSKPPRWWRWARKHPGALLLGAVVLAVLLGPHPWAKHPPAAERDADETPLFI
jgi:hypothetical protein